MNWSVNLEGGRDLCVGGFKFGVWTQFLFINKKDVFSTKIPITEGLKKNSAWRGGIVKGIVGNLFMIFF